MEAATHGPEAALEPAQWGVAGEQIAIALIAAAAFAVHLLNLGGYGYFRDELYYIACARHLAFGYVDHPPLSIAILYLFEHVLGNSILAIRIPSALASAGLVIMTARLARAMGGRGFAAVLAALAALTCPVLLGTSSFFSMNAFEPLFWTAAAYVLVRIINTGDGRLWILFGAIVGLGLENKHSMLFFTFGIAAGVIMTEHRRWLWSGWLWMAAAVALLLFVPNLVWEAAYGWPTLEFMRNAQANKNYHASLPEFLLAQIVQTSPIPVLVWFAGLYWYFASLQGRRYRLFGWAYVAIFVVYVSEGAKAYYLAAIYPTMFAGGAIWLEQLSRERKVMRAAIASVLVLGGAVAAPLAMPLLEPAALVNYSHFLGMDAGSSKQVLEGERHQMSALPQLFADRLGWEQMVAQVAQVYRGLTPQERDHCAIFASNYGEAGAIDFFGPKYGLPNATSNHNNYWLWGPPKIEPEVVIVLNARREEMEQAFADVKEVAVFQCDYCMPFETDLPIYIGRRPKQPFAKVWPRAKHYI